ncbi:MAG: hypothetical protein SGPRY_010223 [Prymnesium sp.]
MAHRLALQEEPASSLADPEEWLPHPPRRTPAPPCCLHCIRALAAALLVALALFAAAILHVIDGSAAALSPRNVRRLSGPDVRWRCMNANRSISLPITLPSVVHTALVNAGVLQGDPLYRFNEIEFSWVTSENWSFSADFVLGNTLEVDKGPPSLLLLRSQSLPRYTSFQSAPPLSTLAVLHESHFLIN